MTTQHTRLPSREELLGYFDSLSNWGRWGDDDELGTINLITPEKRKQAMALVQEGTVVSLGRDLDPGDPDPLARGSVLQRYMLIYGGTESEVPGTDLGKMGGVREFCGIIPHGSHTHLDTLAHLSWEGRCYNGIPAAETTPINGAKKLDVSILTEGIVTRGVLLDIPALKGKPWLDPGEAVHPEDLDAAEERQGVRVGEGDALLLYTGHYRMLAEQGGDPDHHAPGYSASCLPWLHERGISLLTSDTLNDVQPSGYDDFELVVPVHVVSLVAMGLWLADHLILEDLAAKCAEANRWEFLFTMVPWRFKGATSSPVNPLATF